MIVLDTNVFSELMRGSHADQAVLRWSSQLPERPVTTVLTRAEVQLGIELMPPGRRRDELRRDAASLFDALRQALPFAAPAADAYAELVGRSRQDGRPIGQSDAMIAAICRVHAATLATRDVKDFETLGIDLVNPWET